jgi:UDP-N-acetylmuramoylalanine--D-glutamate ligase
VRHVVLIGEAAQTLGQIFGDHVTLSYAHAMDEAVAQAKAAAKPKDSVLLSPACASLDMFKNYEHRGQVFMDCVAKL